MNIQDLKGLFENGGFNEYKPRTLANSFLSTKRNSLVAQQTHNRSSADWKKAMFIIVEAIGAGRINDMTP